MLIVQKLYNYLFNYVNLIYIKKKDYDTYT